MDERLKQILRCMKELEQCERDMHTYKGDPLTGPALGQMDWLTELHYHIHQNKEAV
jgi:hypothetical protein